MTFYSGSQKLARPVISSGNNQKDRRGGLYGSHRISQNIKKLNRKFDLVHVPDEQIPVIEEYNALVKDIKQLNKELAYLREKNAMLGDKLTNSIQNQFEKQKEGNVISKNITREGKLIFLMERVKDLDNDYDYLCNTIGELRYAFTDEAQNRIYTETNEEKELIKTISSQIYVLQFDIQGVNNRCHCASMKFKQNTIETLIHLREFYSQKLQTLKALEKNYVNQIQNFNRVIQYPVELKHELAALQKKYDKLLHSRQSRERELENIHQRRNASTSLFYPVSPEVHPSSARTTVYSTGDSALTRDVFMKEINDADQILREEEEKIKKTLDGTDVYVTQYRERLAVFDDLRIQYERNNNQFHKLNDERRVIYEEFKTVCEKPRTEKIEWEIAWYNVYNKDTTEKLQSFLDDMYEIVCKYYTIVDLPLPEKVTYVDELNWDRCEQDGLRKVAFRGTYRDFLLSCELNDMQCSENDEDLCIHGYANKGEKCPYCTAKRGERPRLKARVRSPSNDSNAKARASTQSSTRPLRSPRSPRINTGVSRTHRSRADAKPPIFRISDQRRLLTPPNSPAKAPGKGRSGGVTGYDHLKGSGNQQRRAHLNAGGVSPRHTLLNRRNAERDLVDLDESHCGSPRSEKSDSLFIRSLESKIVAEYDQYGSILAMKPPSETSSVRSLMERTLPEVNEVPTFTQRDISEISVLEETETELHLDYVNQSIHKEEPPDQFTEDFEQMEENSPENIEQNQDSNQFGDSDAIIERLLLG